MSEKQSFKKVEGRYNGPNLETDILTFWEQNDIFQKSIDQSQGKPRFSFNEGPPTANGKPGIHHVLARAYKDIFPRYTQPDFEKDFAQFFTITDRTQVVESERTIYSMRKRTA